MLLSHYLLPTLKENPAESVITSHRLMLRSGMIRQSSSGIYTWLPLGLKVLRNIEKIIREEQERVGSLEILMPTIQTADLWRESGRYDDYGQEMLRMTDRHKRELLYGPTNEEQVTQIIRDNITSYKDLPCNLYHIQWKFRDEIRPRFGVMRGREFLMKDAYSFDLTEEEARISYQKMFVVYLRIFKRLGLKVMPMSADTGPIGGDMSHEFVILAQTGESEVYCHKDLIERDIDSYNIDYDNDLSSIISHYTDYYATTDEKYNESDFFSQVPEDKRIHTRGIEVGHIFYFGQKYTIPMKCSLSDMYGKMTPLYCGSYGIGVSRLVATIIEAYHDDYGIIWPSSVAPFQVGLINLRIGYEGTDSMCQKIYDALTNAQLDVLYDNRDERAGEKFSNMDLIGIPWQIIIGPRGGETEEVEIKNRETGQREIFTLETAIQIILERNAERN